VIRTCAVTLALTACLIFFSTAADAEQRTSGAVWLTTRSAAELKLKRRFANIRAVSCSPDRTSPTRVYGTVRYWQRFWCKGTTRDSISFSLRFKATGECPACWTILNLRGTGAAHLRSRPSSPPPSTRPPTPNPPPPPAPTAPGVYYATGSGHWIDDVSANGAIITLEDGSLWNVAPIDRIDTSLWLPVDEITVLWDGGNAYRLINTDEGEVAHAAFLGFS
jgi:hypothetical protein